MSNLWLKQTNRWTLSGGCNEPCTRQLHRNALNAVGFESCVSSPALLHCEKLDASMVVHGDDFITLGDDDALSEVEHVMSSHYTIEGSSNPWCESR